MTRPETHELRGYVEYLAHTKAEPRAIERQRVVRFWARWRLAKTFVGLRLSGTPDVRTTRGYDALLRVTLAYSVLDQYVSVSQVKIQPIIDTDLANDFADTMDLEAIRQNEKTSGMRKHGQIDSAQDVGDVVVFAQALRHMFVHGSGTPWGVDAKNQAAVRVLNRLADRMLFEAENRFESWVSQRIST